MSSVMTLEIIKRLKALLNKRYKIFSFCPLETSVNNVKTL